MNAYDLPPAGSLGAPACTCGHPLEDHEDRCYGSLGDLDDWTSYGSDPSEPCACPAYVADR